MKRVKKLSVEPVAGTCLALTLLLTLMTGCSTANAADNQKNAQTAVPVSTLTAANSSYAVYMDYKGYAVAKDIKKLSFEVPGKIKTMGVEKGRQISAGQVLAELDESSIKLGIENSNKSIELAQDSVAQLKNSIEKIDAGIAAEMLNLEKIYDGIETERLNLRKLEDTYNLNIQSLTSSYNHTKDMYDQTAALYELGEVSQSNVNDALYALNAAEKELEKVKQSRDYDLALAGRNIESMESNAKLQQIKIQTLQNDRKAAVMQIDSANTQVEQALIGLKQSDKQLNDCVLISPMDGYVVDVIMQEGEIVGAGVPVVIIKSGNIAVNIGVSVEDYSKITAGATVEMESNGDKFSGAVSSIAQYPDEGTMTYNVEIIPEKADIATGAMIDVKIPLESRDGVFVPIQAVLKSEGVNYVFCVSSDEDKQYLVKKVVELGEVTEELVMLKNINPGEIIVTGGVKNLKDNDLVIVSEG